MRLFLSCFAGVLPLVCLAFPLTSAGMQDMTSCVTTRIMAADKDSCVASITQGDIATQTTITKGALYVIPFQTSVTRPTTTITTATKSLKSLWEAPSLFHDLSLFSITGFPVGRENLAVVTSIPATASASYVFSGSQKAASDNETRKNATSILQVLYPAHSINPSRKPQGGAEFYAIPIDISHARNVTLCYSVFFPQDFDYVLAGKLPGLYGGHSGCSGGNQATSCFSTRLMWRTGGMGELYLYAPRDKQTETLCADPGSVCDLTYGISIGRGSFNWSAGHWTRICQTVSLNTPGFQDGSFALDVNNFRVIDRHDVFYRDLPPLESSEEYVKAGEQYLIDAPDDGSGTVPRIFWRLVVRLFALACWHHDVQNLSETTRYIDEPSSTLTVTNPVFPSLSAETRVSTAITFYPTECSIPAIGFVGLFFSTFFGGHEDQYETPRDQFAWFKGFQITYNS